MKTDQDNATTNPRGKFAADYADIILPAKKERVLIIITGHPGSGKTTLAKWLSRHHRIPYVSKDALKEHMFDALGSKDKAWSLKVSAASHRIMDDMISQELAADQSIIVESNFKPELDSVRFRTIAKTHQATCVQILCHANQDTLFKRWTDRIARGVRHEGHIEAISLDQIKEDRAVPYPPLDLPGELIEIDTSTPTNSSKLRQ